MKGEIKIKRTTSDTEVPLIYYIRNGEVKSRTNIGIKMLPKYWKNGKLKTSHPDYNRLDYIISEKQTLLKKALYEGMLNNWSVKQVGSFLSNEGKIVSLDFLEYADDLIERRKVQGKFGTANTYRDSISFLRNKYLLKNRLLFSELDLEFMQNYTEYLTSKTNTTDATTLLKSSTVHLYARTVRTIYNRAIEEEVYTPPSNKKYPFTKVIPRYRSTGSKDLTEEQVMQLEAYSPDKKRKNFVMAKNYWLLAFYLRGLDFVDLSMIKKSNVFRGRIITKRHKGMAKENDIELSIKIFPKAQKIIDYFVELPGRENATFLFPINDKYGNYDKSEKTLWYYDRYRGNINAELTKIKRDLKFDTGLSTKVTRHTFATLARYKRVDFEIIQEMLGHSRGSVTDIYMSKFSNEEIDQAHALVINEII